MHKFYKCLLSVCLLAAGVPHVKAQLILNREVHASSGGTGVAGGWTFQYTIGEPIVSTIFKGPFMLTQGFQQPEELPPANPGTQPVLNMIVYPNPASTNVKIQFDMLSANSVALMIINSSGQLVYRQTGTYAAGRVVLNLPVNHFAAGIYTVRLIAGGYDFQDKLIIL